MTYKFSLQQKILRVLADGQHHKPGYISSQVGVTRVTLNKYLKKLVEENIVSKTGKAPHVFYALSDLSLIPENYTPDVYHEHDFLFADTKALDSTFYKFAPDGAVLEGTQGFIQRCIDRKFDIYEKYADYKLIYTTIESLYNQCGLLDASKEFSKHVETMALDHLYYAGQYKRNEFGRSRLAELGFYGKQTQNKQILDIVCQQIISPLECLIKTQGIDALAFTPPSLHRNVQILDIIDHKLQHISLPRIRLVKDYPNNVITTQKSLRKRADRLLNARNTIYIDDPYAGIYKHILLIDDFVGSGSTLNETAKKLKHAGAQRVSGFAIVGNLDLSYEVINEM